MTRQDSKWNLPVVYDALSPPERREVRQQYIREQFGRCHHCDGDLDKPSKGPSGQARINRKLFPESFFKFPVHLHHDHTTGLTIGAVHNRCNAYLWQYKGE